MADVLITLAEQVVVQELRRLDASITRNGERISELSVRIGEDVADIQKNLDSKIEKVHERIDGLSRDTQLLKGKAAALGTVAGAVFTIVLTKILSLWGNVPPGP